VVGTRYAYLSRDGNRLFGSSAAAHYYWDADTLARPRASGPELKLVCQAPEAGGAGPEERPPWGVL